MQDQYRDNQYDWQTVRDAVAGESRIKRKNEEYLPMPSAMQGQLVGPQAVPSAEYGYGRSPNWHWNPAYQAYKTRARFPGITGFFLRGLTGLASSAKYTYEHTAQYDHIDAHQLFTDVVSELLQVGRCLLVVDGENIVLYKAESITEWAEERIEIQQDEDTRIVIAIEDGAYTVSEFVEGAEVATAIIVPKANGQPLTILPVVWCGSIKNDCNCDISPLYPIASIAIQIYMCSADAGQSRFVSCSPTLVMTGIEPSQAPTAVGSGVAIVIPNPNGQAYYTTTDTAALQYVRAEIDALYDEASAYGANLLGGNKKAVESAEALRLRQAAAGATLVNIVSNASTAVNDALGLLAELNSWPEAEFSVSTEFHSASMAAPEMAALLQSWMAGGISQFTYLENLRKAGLLGNDNTEAEIERIESQKPMMQSQGQPDAG